MSPTPQSGCGCTAIRLELEALADRVAALEQRASHVSRRDRAVLARVLPVLAATFGSTPLLAREVVDHEAPGLRLVCAGLNGKRLGRLLQRAEGQAIAGYVVERLGQESGGIIWQVSGVVLGLSKAEKHPDPLAQPAAGP